MRFFWLAMTIATPIFVSHMFEAEHREAIQNTYALVGLVFMVIALGLTIAEFVKHRNRERHAENRRLLQERDDDIAKWRKAFFAETADLYDAQKAMLTKAQELGDHHATYIQGRAATTRDDGEAAGVG